MKMQPGDWIAKEDIRSPDHLECIREAVRAQGWPVSKHLGQYKRREGWPYLNLDDAGDLVWSTRCSGRRIDPTELLGEGLAYWARRVGNPVGHPAADILQQLADEARVNPEPWREFQTQIASDDWVTFKSLAHMTDYLHSGERVRRRPRTIRIGEFDVPEPAWKEPEPRTQVWIANPTTDDFCHSVRYVETEWFLQALRRGLIHLDPKAAAIHGRAIASLTAREE